MKEYILQLLEELVGAHTLRVKQEKAAEIAALVKTAVFPTDEVEPDRETAVWESEGGLSAGDESAAKIITFRALGIPGSIPVVPPFAKAQMKLFVWNRPYQVDYGCSMVFAIADTIETARALACSQEAKRFSFNAYEQDSCEWRHYLGDPIRIVDLPCAEWHEWSE